MALKRILVISYHTCPLAFEEGKETGGMNVYVYELSRHLARRGVMVDVITRCQDIKSERIVQVSKNFRVIHLIAGPPTNIHKDTLRSFIPEFITSFQKFTETEKLTYNIIHAHYFLSGLIGLEIKKIFSYHIPLVISFHTLALMKNLVARSAGELGSQARIDAEMLLTKEADVIISPSTSDKQYLQYLYDVSDKKIFEIPPGVNTTLFKPIPKLLAKAHIGLKTHEKIILFVGRIEPLKGIDVLLYALKIFRVQHPHIPIRLLIVGGDVSQHITKWSAQLKQLDLLAHTLGISDYVDFIGQRPQHELPYYYNCAEVVIMPSHYESFGMAAAEAMACGIPVITTNVTGISHLIDELRFWQITSVNNPLLLASQIKRLLSDETLYQHIRNMGLKNAQNLRWDIIAKQISDVYLQCL